MSQPKEYTYEKGDLVRLRVSPKIAGQVIAEEGWGESYGVRLAGSTEVEWFEVEELEFVPVREAVAAQGAIPTADVIDFTKARELRRNTKTRRSGVMFKKGDRVRRKAGDWDRMEVGDVAVVLSCSPRGILKLESYGDGHDSSNFEPAPLFAVGDKVRVVVKPTNGGYGEVGDTGSVKRADTSSILMDFETGKQAGSAWYISADVLERLPEPVAVAASNDNATPAKFKVGDRVRGVCFSYEYRGKSVEGLITAMDDTSIPYLIEMDDGKSAWLDKEGVSLVSAPLTIAAGKYYRTRDGRKVGPMDSDDAPGYMWADVEGVTRSFNIEGGAHCDETDLDLIAEWPETNTDILDELENWMADNPIDDDYAVGESDATPIDATLSTKITVDFTDFDAELDRIFARLRKLRRKSKKMGIKVDSSGLQDAA